MPRLGQAQGAYPAAEGEIMSLYPIVTLSVADIDKVTNRQRSS